jgi:hypothetical protein
MLSVQLRAELFVANKNNRAKITLAAQIIRQQSPPFDLEVKEIRDLSLSKADLDIAMEETMNGNGSVPTTDVQSSSVTIISRECPSLSGVITEKDVKAVHAYSTMMGTTHIDLNKIVDRYAYSTIDTSLKARGRSFGITDPYINRWISWDHCDVTPVTRT